MFQDIILSALSISAVQEYTKQLQDAHLGLYEVILRLLLCLCLSLEHDFRPYNRTQVEMNSDRNLFHIFIFRFSYALGHCDALS